LDYFSSPIEVINKLIDIFRNVTGGETLQNCISPKRIVDSLKFGLVILGDLLESDEFLRKRVKKFIQMCLHAQIEKTYFEDSPLWSILSEPEWETFIQSAKKRKSKKISQQLYHDREKDTEKTRRKKKENDEIEKQYKIPKNLELSKR